MKNSFVWLILGIIVLAAISYFLKVNVYTNLLHQGKTTNRLQVTTSFYPLYFFASQIGGDKAQVQNITPSGAEPHDYEPTAQDIARIERSDLLILNGGNLEAWGNKIQDILKSTYIKIIIAGENLTNQTVDENGQTIRDPHVWLSPPLAEKEVMNITQGFIQVDPQNKNYYETNEKNLLARLDDLDKKYQHGLAQCTSHDIITSHAAFGYLAKTYHLNQIPISGLSPDEEPSPKQLAEVAKFAEDHHVKYIFFESLVSPKLSETIASEVGVQTLVLDPIEGISNDDMKIGKNYFTIMEDNLKNLQLALGCTQTTP